MKQLRLAASLFLLFLVACSSAAPTATPTVPPTATPTATATVAATPTPKPTLISEPTPTIASTVPPTATATATATPEPTPTPPPTATSIPTLDPALTENVNILLLVPNRYGANYHLNIDNFELYGWNVTRAGVRERIQPCASFAAPHGCPPLTADLLISDVGDVSAYDALAIMPSNKGVADPYGDLLKSQEAMDLIVSAVEEGLAVYAPCAGVGVLAAAGVLDGKAVTGVPAQRGEYEAAGATYLGDQLPPVIDGNIVTTRRGMYYNVQNCEAIATILENSQDEGAAVAEKPTLTQSGAFERDDALWTRTFGGLSAEGGRSVSETSDGGSIIAGYTYSFGAGQADVYLLKTDFEGNEQWSRAYGGPGWEYGFAVSQTRDEGYVLAGYTTSYGAGSKDVYLLKTDSQGNESWSKTFGGPGLDVGRSVVETRDGDYVVAGYTESFGVPESDVYVIKTDSQGNELWSKTFGGSGPDVGQSVIETNDGGYVVVGASGSFDSGNQDVYLLKISPSGQQLWAKALNPGVYDWGKAVRETSDGGYIIVGDTTGPSLASGELLDFFLIKTDTQGHETWTTIFGRSDFYDHGNSVYETSDGGYIAVGTAKSGSGNNDVYLVKVDAGGSVVWKDALGSRGSDWGSAVYVTKDGDYVIAGHTSSHGAGTFDVWLVKVAGVESE